VRVSRNTASPRRRDDLRDPRPDRSNDDGRTKSLSCAGDCCSSLPPRRSYYDQPSNMFVAEFIGSPSINLYEAELEEGSAAVNVGGQRLELSRSVVSARPALQAFAGRKVIVGIRPEDLLLDGTSAGSGDTLAGGQVQVVESLGSEMLVHFTVDAPRVHAEGAQAVAEEALTTDAELTRRDLSIARAEPRSGVRSGEHVSFTVRAHAHAVLRRRLRRVTRRMSAAPALSADELFEEVFTVKPEGLWSAPGRVNLIGDFTDINDGLVLPSRTSPAYGRGGLTLERAQAADRLGDRRIGGGRGAISHDAKCAT